MHVYDNYRLFVGSRVETERLRYFQPISVLQLLLEVVVIAGLLVF